MKDISKIGKKSLRDPYLVEVYQDHFKQTTQGLCAKFNILTHVTPGGK